MTWPWQLCVLSVFEWSILLIVFFWKRSVLCILDRRLHIFVVKAWLINHFEEYFTFYIVLHHTIQYLVRESINFMKHDWKHIVFKQEARGSHRLLEKKFQSINRFAQSYTITLIKRERKTITSFLRNKIVNGPLFCLKLSPLYPRMLCAKFRRNWPSNSEDLKVSSNMYFRYFVIMSLGKGRVPSFEQTWIPFT